MAIAVAALNCTFRFWDRTFDVIFVVAGGHGRSQEAF